MILGNSLQRASWPCGLKSKPLTLNRNAYGRRVDLHGLQDEYSSIPKLFSFEHVWYDLHFIDMVHPIICVIHSRISESWAEIQQFALIGLSSSLHSEACNAFGAPGGVTIAVFRRAGRRSSSLLS